MTLADRLPPPDPYGFGLRWALRERVLDLLHWASRRRGNRARDAAFAAWDVLWFVGTRTRAFVRYQRDRLLERR